MYESDIINQLVDEEMKYKNEETFIIDFSSYFEVTTKSDIESMLDSNDLIYEYLGDGRYKIYREKDQDNLTKEQLKKFVKEKIETIGFDEYGNLMIDLSMLFNLTDIHVIKTIRELGLYCEKLDGDGKCWVCWFQN